MSEWAEQKLKDLKFDPQKLSNEEKRNLYKGLVIMEFPKMDLKRSKSVIKSLTARRVKQFQNKVRIEISAVQRTLRDIEIISPAYSKGRS